MKIQRGIVSTLLVVLISVNSINALFFKKGSESESAPAVLHSTGSAGITSGISGALK